MDNNMAQAYNNNTTHTMTPTTQNSSSAKPYIPETPKPLSMSLANDIVDINRQYSHAVQNIPIQTIDTFRQSGTTPSVSLTSLITNRDHHTGDSISDTITVYGIQLSQLDSILPRFVAIGDIINIDKSDHTQSANTAIQPNWIHLQYSDPVHAQIALQLNGTIINGLMIGVKMKQTTPELNITSVSNQPSIFNPSTINQSQPLVKSDTNIYKPVTNIGFSQRLYNYITQCMFDVYKYGNCISH